MKAKLSWLETVLLTAPFAVLAIYWNDLPARVPIHWNFHGQIDGWGAKTLGIFIIPLTALGMTALLRVLPWFDPRLRRTLGDESLMPAVIPIVRLAVLLLLDTIFFVQIAVSLGITVPGGRIIVSAVLLFLMVLGNYLGNVRPNYFVGVRTPWTLENTRRGRQHIG